MIGHGGFAQEKGLAGLPASRGGVAESLERQ
jgi:hypothetical protein